MSACETIETDSSSLKRSFDAVRDPYRHHNSESRDSSDGETVNLRSVKHNYRRGRALKRRPVPSTFSPAMPVHSTVPFPSAFPSFMSVFGGGMDSTEDGVRVDPPLSDSRGETQGNFLISTKSSQTDFLAHAPYSQQAQQQTQHESAPSFSSDSSESSPTTTSSTFDSPATAEQSPSSSPESPISYLPLPSLLRSMEPQKNLAVPEDTSPVTNPLSPLDRSESPSNKERNVKNLSLNMNISAGRPASPSAGEGVHAFSAPTSPLKGPLKSARRRPNNLTIQTPGFDKASFSACEIPPTPSFRPGLKQHESSPALPSLSSPRAAPYGGMQLPSLSLNHLTSRPGSVSSLTSLTVPTQGLNDVKEDRAEADAPPKSQEVQERGYTSGPVMIYDSGVYLYLEPSREEASKFDTVINVAKEVASPFSAGRGLSKPSVVSVWRNSSRGDLVEPQTAVSERSFQSAFEWPEATASTSPSTPKATQREPEYLHVPWDHNSEIVDELYPLCQIIDSRVSAGKTVLIHCQLGVSRSASLVIAYGLYKGYKTDFHSMYTSVKERSQWVGPNMSLIYQLMDFRTKVANGDFARSSKPPSQDWFLNAVTESEMTPRPRSVSPIFVKAPKPQVSVSVPSASLEKPLPPIPLFSELRQENRKPSLPTVFSGIALSSPPPSSPILESPSSVISVATFQTAPPIPPRSAKRGASRPLPLRERMFSPPQFDIPPHSPREASDSVTFPPPISYPPLKMDLVMQDEPQTPSLFSPRTTEFKAVSFAQSTAGDLAQNTRAARTNNKVRMSVFSIPQPTAAVDPRSPHHGDETGEILRHIDDVLEKDPMTE